MASPKHTLIALVEDRPGVLNRIASLFRRRGFNIQSLTVGPSEIPNLSRMTIVVDGVNTQVEQVSKQLYKVIDVVKVSELTEDESVVRELALVKVATAPGARSEVIEIAGIYRANIVDVAPDCLIVEVTGTEDKVEALIQLLRPYGIREIVRTGRTAMARGASRAAPPEESTPGGRQVKHGVS